MLLPRVSHLRILFVCMLTALGAVGCGAQTPSVDSSAPTQLPSHIPAVVNRAIRLQRVASDRTLSLRVNVALQNEEDLDAALASMYDPRSANFHKFLTPDQFAATYHPDADAVAKVGAALEAAGMQVTGVHGSFVEVDATAAQAQSFFNTELYNYSAPDGQTFRAPAQEASVPAGLPIRAVHGLAGGLLHRSHRVMPKATPRGVASGLTPSTIKSAYNIPSTYTGTGQTVGLFEFDGYTASDVQAYENTYSLPSVPLTNIMIDNYSGRAGDAADEVTLDIEMVAAMAPGVDEIRVYEQSGTGSDIDMLNEIVNPTQGDKKLVSIISCSFGNAEDQVSTSNLNSDNTLFKQMAAQGQTFYDASGDSGAREDGTNLSVDEYAGQPYVVAVGGTTLNQSNGTYQSESTWLDGGGGVSGKWPLPTWQSNGVVSTATRGSQTMRNTPDVALNSDPNTGYEFYFGGQLQYGGGGTSFAAPLWAGFHALVDQARANANLTPIGFLTPAIYSLGQTSAYPSIMHDIADNSTNGYYPAVANFDDATGWGTINGAPLIAALAAGGQSSNGGGSTTNTGGSTGSDGGNSSGIGNGSAGTDTEGTGNVAGVTGSTSTATCAAGGGGVFIWAFALVFLPRRTRRMFTAR